MGKITINLLAVLFALAPYVHGQTVVPQWNWPVSSDFGPRLVDSDDDGQVDDWDFHEGVDFNPVVGNSDLGTPIPNLEGGPIFTIADNATFLEARVYVF